jgi:pyruvate carboxylase
VADAALAAMSGGTSQPNLNSIVEALRHTARDTQLDIATLNECSDYWEVVRTYYLPFDSGPKAGSARLYQHEIPGGQFTNLREQAVAMGLGHRWREVETTYAEVNQLFGDIVKVTPSSKVVGDMTLFLMAKDMQPQDLLKLDEKHDLSLPTPLWKCFRESWACLQAAGRKNCRKSFCTASNLLKVDPARTCRPRSLKRSTPRSRKKSATKSGAPIC